MVIICGVVELDVIIFIVVVYVLLVVAGVVLVVGGRIRSCFFDEVELGIGVAGVVFCVVGNVELDVLTGDFVVVLDFVVVVYYVVVVELDELTGGSVVVVVFRQ